MEADLFFVEVKSEKKQSSLLTWIHDYQTFITTSSVRDMAAMADPEFVPWEQRVSEQASNIASFMH